MFDVKLSGTQVSIIRDIDLPKVAPLPAFKQKIPYKVTLDFGDLDPKSAEGKRVLKAFPVVYAKALKQVGNPRRADNKAIWKEAAVKIAKGEDAKSVREATQKHLEGRWDAFNKTYINSLAIQTLSDLCVTEFGQKAAKNFKFKAKYNYKGVWGDFAKIFVGLGVFAAAVFTGGTILAVAGAVTALSSARKLSEKHYLDIGHIYRNLDKQLKKSAKDLGGLTPQAKDLSKKVPEVQKLIVNSKKLVDKVQKDVDALKKEVADHPDGAKRMNEMRLLLAKAQVNLDQQKKFSADLARDSAAILKLIDEVAAVSASVEVQHSRYDKVLALSKAMSDLVSDADSGVKGFKALG
ncbi:MAG: hypothetical protein AAF252_02540 [Pseudomonadota bacterium]